MTLTITYDRESSVHSVGITQASKLSVKFYPESTDLLVPGVSSKVYFETLSTPDGTEDVADFQNADLIAKDLDSGNESVIMKDIKS